MATKYAARKKQPYQNLKQEKPEGDRKAPKTNVQGSSKTKKNEFHCCKPEVVNTNTLKRSKRD